MKHKIKASLEIFAEAFVEQVEVHWVATRGDTRWQAMFPQELG